MAKYSVRNLNKVPWFIYSVATSDLIISNTIPEQIRDSKQITRAFIQVPGGNSEVSKFGSIASRRLSFSIRLAQFNTGLGVTPKIKALEALRNPVSSSITGFGETPPFSPNPEVVYYYGTGSLPLFYFVTQCDFVLSYPNRLGMPQVAEVSFELVLNSNNFLARAEETYRKVTAKLGLVQSLREGFGTRHPYLGGNRTI